MIKHRIRNTLFISTGLILLSIFIVLLLPNHKKSSITINNQAIAFQNEPLYPVIQQYLNFIEANLDSAHNIGAALTIVEKVRVLLLKTFGVKKINTHDSINLHTVFRLASVSKGFTGVLSCILEEEGAISLQNKIQSFLPDFRLKDSVNTYEMNVQHLLSHTSGLVPHAYDNLIEDGLPLHIILSNLQTVDISAPPGQLYGYQNVLFSLIDTITYIQTGVNYNHLLERYIFRPLDMHDASVGPKIFSRKNANIASPHRRSDTSYIAIPLNLGYYNISPAAGVNASISDLSKWLQALLGQNPGILDSSLLARIAQPLIVTPLKYRYTRYWDKIDAKYYSLGWRIYQYKGRKILYHGGFVKGYRAEIAFCPDENIGIAFLQNSPNSVASMCVPAFFNSYFHFAGSDSKQDSFTDNKIFNGFIVLEDSSNDYDQDH